MKGGRRTRFAARAAAAAAAAAAETQDEEHQRGAEHADGDALLVFVRQGIPPRLGVAVRVDRFELAVPAERGVRVRAGGAGRRRYARRTR